MRSLGLLFLLSGCQIEICKCYFFSLDKARDDSNPFLFFLYSPYNSDCSIQRLLIGTHTSNDEQNYVQIVKVKIPLESSKDTKDYRENICDEGGVTNGLGNNRGNIGKDDAEKKKNERIQVEMQINH